MAGRMGCCGTGLLCTHWRAVADGGLGSIDGVVAVLEVLQLLRSMARPLPNAPTRGGVSVVGVGRASVCGRAPGWLSAFRCADSDFNSGRTAKPCRLHHAVSAPPSSPSPPSPLPRSPPALARALVVASRDLYSYVFRLHARLHDRYLLAKHLIQMCVDHGRWSLRPTRCSVPLATSQPHGSRARRHGRR